MVSPNRKTKSGNKKSKRRRVAWWEDWRWLTGIGGGMVLLALLAIVVFSRGDVDPVAADNTGNNVAADDANPALPAATPTVAVDERPIAEWVLKVGGSVTVVDRTDAQFYITRADQIPVESVRVIGVNLCDLKSFKDDDLARLEKCSALEELLLDRTNISLAGLNALGTQAALLRLSIEDCPLPEQAVTPIGKFKNLQMLTLSIPLSDSAISELRGLTKLRALRFTGPRSSDIGLKLICESFPELTHLITDQMALTEAGLEPLSRLRKLRMLGLTRSPLDDDATTPLGKLRSLTHLLIPGTQVTRTGTRLLKISLPNCQIFGGKYDARRMVAARILMEGGKLTAAVNGGPTRIYEVLDDLPEEDFECTTIDLSGAQTLSRGSLKSYLLNDIQSLKLNNSTLDGVDLAHLPQATPKLRVLDISGTKVDDNHVPLLGKIRTLEGLHAVKSALSDDGLVRLRIGMPPGCEVFDGTPVDPDIDRNVALWALEIGGTVTVGVAGTDKGINVGTPDDLPKGRFLVRRLHLENRKRVTDTDFQRFPGLRYVTTIAVHGCPVTDACVTPLEDMPALVEFSIGAAITDVGLKSLSKHRHLEELQLQGAKITANGFRSLGKHLSLRKLYVGYEEFDDECLIAIRDISPFFWHVKFFGNKITTAGLKAFAMHPNTLQVWITEIPVGVEEGVNAICEMPSLLKLQLGGKCHTDESVAGLLRRTKFEAIYLENTRVTQVMIQSLQEKHPKMTISVASTQETIKQLLAGGCTVTVVSATGETKELIKGAEIPEGDIRVTRLNTNGNPIYTPTFSGLGSLEELILRDSPFSAKDVSYFYGFKNLKLLDLSGTATLDVHFEQFPAMPSLKTLDLRRTSVTKPTVDRLQKANPGCKILYGD